MRFLFPGDGARERREREQMLDRMDLLHRELDQVLSGGDERLGRARALVRTLDECIGLELLAAGADSELVVVSPRGERRRRPLVDTFVARAPERAGRRWLGYHPARTLAQTLALVRGEHGYELDGARARAGFSRGHLLDVVVYAPGFGGVGDERAAAAAEHAVESLLGERVLDDWIGQVSAEPLPRGGPLRVVSTDAAPTFPIADLPAAISRAVEGLSLGLPALGPKALARESWTLFEAEPEIAADYAGLGDVALASSAVPEMTKCFLEGSPFSSLRFAPNGEIFAYLKLDGGRASFEQRVEERARLEDALGRELAERAQGGVVGSALGVRYVYVMLVLAPGRGALDVVADVARRSGAPERAWIQFCDSDWADEWVGVWPETPPPFSARSE